MPLPERVVAPVNISRGTLQCPVPDELEGVTNGTLANIIRQLSSLSRHAEEMFGNLFKDAEGIAVRSSDLQARIDRLAVRVTQLDSNVEEVSLQDIQLRKAFRSSQSFDQQVVSRETMPKAMLEVYMACDKPPPLDKLNPYREDGKDGLKFYTDPNYFFELWRQDMLKGTERMINDRGKKPGRNGVTNGTAVGGGGSGQKSDRHKKRVRQPHNTAERQRQKAIGQGEFVMSPNGEEEFYHHNDMSSELPARPNSIEIKRSYPNNNHANNNLSNGYNNYQQEPIYTPRILRNNDPEKSYTDNSSNGYRSLEQQQQFNMSPQQQNNYDYRETTPGTPSRRPSQPPPAPPPGATPPMGGTPTRSSQQRDSLPLPPPPPQQQQLMNEVNAVLSNGVAHSSPDNNKMQSPLRSQIIQQSSPPHVDHHHHQNSADHLPPPPPVPANNSLGVKIPPEHLPPSPPPPPAPDSAPAPPVGAPPPPPPPPPTNGGLTNSDLINNHKNTSNSPIKTTSSPVKSILSPPVLKKPAPLHKPPQDNVRSDLLKAIRDGIALKKVEAQQSAEQSGAGGTDVGANTTDVASILARRVAVEMSDSDDGPTDSECDSDDWGDESTA